MLNVKVFALPAALLLGLLVSAHADTAKPVPDGKTLDSKTLDSKPVEKKAHSRAEVEAFLTKCSQEADEKGLDVKKGKGAERKAFRRECMKKFGVEAK